MIRRKRLFSALLALGLVGTMGMSAHAADIELVNQDAGTQKGLDDPTPATPVGMNPGTTRGEQALIVFQFAADLWGSVLQSDVPIINTVTFQPLSCNATSGVLGSSGTNYIFAFNDGPSLPEGALADTWYHSALADALAGTDLGVENDLPPDTPDIVSRFNGDLGKAGCLEDSGWYFGLDGNPPSGQIDLLNVVMHEMAHGLGFSGFNNLASGTLNQGQIDIYSLGVKDNSTGKMWVDMSDAERQTAALNDGHLVYTGAEVKAQAPLALETPITLTVTAPSAIAGDYDYNAAEFGAEVTVSSFSGEAVVPSSDSLACNVDDAPAAVDGVSGKIALLDRGTCAFTEKAANAQAGGATGVIIVNNEESGIIPAGDDASITIPVIGVTQSVGESFKANVPVSLGLVEGEGLAGGDADGNVQLYAPTTLAQGSSFSHYDTRLTPNAIMEYAINPDLQANFNLDLTPALLEDEGWAVNQDGRMLLQCDTGVPASIPGGIIMGSNVYAMARNIAAHSADVDAYRQAVRDYAGQLADGGLITADQADSLNACLSDTETEAQFDAWGGDGDEGPGDPGDAIDLANGVPLTGMAGGAGDVLVFALEVPENALALNLRSYGGSGDVSMYVKFGEPGSADDYDSQSARPGNTESVVIARPQAGTYYVTLVGEQAFDGVNVRGSFVDRN